MNLGGWLERKMSYSIKFQVSSQHQSFTDLMQRIICFRYVQRLGLLSVQHYQEGTKAGYNQENHAYRLNLLDLYIVCSPNTKFWFSNTN